MKINVTREHIRKGIARSTTKCPIALAMKAKKLTSISVGDFLIYNGKFIIPTKEVHNFITSFDSHKPVKPFNFELPDG